MPAGPTTTNSWGISPASIARISLASILSADPTIGSDRLDSCFAVLRLAWAVISVVRYFPIDSREDVFPELEVAFQGFLEADIQERSICLFLVENRQQAIGEASPSRVACGVA